ncbi:MAG: NAD(P)-dependent oxidoreductase [Chloroflexi bacterium]|nr:NAD(P)-dependent oxidoreductase [Chloroflexota bacterium]
MRIGVVGASGVLGRALLPLLAEQGHTVIALARSQPVTGPGIHFVAHDLLDAAADATLHRALAGCDAVCHIATAIPRDFAAPGAWDANTRLRTEGTRRLLDVALQSGVKLYIQQSIVMAYVDGGDEWLDETTPLDTSPERAAVCAPVIEMETMVQAVPPSQMQTYILRGGQFVGAGTGQEQTIERLRAGRETVDCDGQYFISPVHVTDMARAVVAVLHQLPAEQIFNITDEPIRQADYLDGLAQWLGVPAPPRRPGQPCPPSFRCSNGLARRVLGWQPEQSIWPEVH